MYQNDYDHELELNEEMLSGKYDIPDAPEHWELDDFDDVVSGIELC